MLVNGESGDHRADISRRAAVSSVLVALAMPLAAKKVAAVEPADDAGGITVPLLTLAVRLPRAASDAVVSREVIAEGAHVRATVYDARSHMEVDRFDEVIACIPSHARVQRDGSLCLASASNYNTELSRNVTLAKPNGISVQSRVWMEVNVTAGQSWGQIERVNACGQRPGSGNYQLEATHTYSSTTKFPTNTVVIGYSGNVLVTNTNTLGISYSGVLSSGFSVSGSASSTWYARKNYSNKIAISLR